MQRTLAAAALVLAACGIDPAEDDRPETLEYVTQAILAPSCGNAQCHSSFRRADGRAYDTVAAACESMLANSGDVVPESSTDSLLSIVLSRTIDRMPYDQPLPEVDQALIRRWIDRGAIGLPADIAECP